MTKGIRQGMIKRQPKKPEEIKVNKLPKKYPDCTLYEYGNVGKYNLIHCKRPNNVAVPHPNCTVWKSNCIFYKKKGGLKMGYIAALLVFSIVNFIISMLIAPPEKKSGKVWFTRYTMLSFRLVVLSMVIYFILDNNG